MDDGKQNSLLECMHWIETIQQGSFNFNPETSAILDTIIITKLITVDGRC